MRAVKVHLFLIHLGMPAKKSILVPTIESGGRLNRLSERFSESPDFLIGSEWRTQQLNGHHSPTCALQCSLTTCAPSRQRTVQSIRKMVQQIVREMDQNFRRFWTCPKMVQKAVRYLALPNLAICVNKKSGSETSLLFKFETFVYLFTLSFSIRERSPYATENGTNTAVWPECFGRFFWMVSCFEA